jgi:nucleotide-binding universal stress UspA family protein
VHAPSTLGYSQDIFHATLDEDGDARMEALAYLERTAESLAGDTRVHVRLLDARSVPEAICAHAAKARTRLIVMTTHGRTGLRRAMLGSVADGVVQRSAAPVLLWNAVHGRPTLRSGVPFRHVLVPLDGSLAAERILPHAALMASIGAGRLTLVRVVGHLVPTAEPPVMMPVSPFLAYASAVAVEDEKATERAATYATAYLATTGSRIGAEFPELVVETRVRVDDRVDVAIIDAVKESGADLVAMTPQGLGTSRLIVGSTVDAVLREWAGAMLLLRPPTE